MPRKPKNPYASLRIKITWSFEQDDSPVRGNALASGDPEMDRECEDAILARLDRGDVLAWCLVRCTAMVTCNGEVFSGGDLLGECSYNSKADFLSGGYAKDMRATAISSLRESLAAAERRAVTACQVATLLDVLPVDEE